MSKSIKARLMLDKIFGRLTVICESKKKSRINRGKFYWTQCSCGNLHVVSGNSLQQGLVKSCGCLKKESSSKNAKSMCVTNTKHGMGKERLYFTWHKMFQRCENPKIHNYRNYGGRGIKVCEEWKDILTFRNWALSNGYRDDLTIDRIDNDGNYEPGNCQWITQSENSHKKAKSIAEACYA